MTTRYVLAVGGTDPSTTAEQWAAAHSEMSGVPLVRVHVPWPSGDVNIGQGNDDRPHVEVLPAGPIPESLARFVRQGDVIVIGTGKTGFIRSRIFGTMSLQIAAASPCTVAVVPQIDLRFRNGVIAGVTDDTLLRRVVHSATEEARSHGETLQLIHSTFDGIVPAPIETSGPVLARAAALSTSIAPNISVRTRVTGRPPAEALLDASRNASLLVIGAGRSGDGHGIGTLTHDLLININAPLLMVAPSIATDAESQEEQ